MANGDRNYPPDYAPDDRRPPAEPVPRPAFVRDDRSLGDLFKELADETRTLVRQEIQLAKTEVGEKAKQAGRNVGLLVAGGLVAYAGLITVAIALGFLLASFLPDWLGFLIAGGLVMAVGGMLALQGRNGLKNTRFSLDRTAETLKEDKQWLKTEIQEVKDDPGHLGARR